MQLLIIWAKFSEYVPRLKELPTKWERALRKSRQRVVKERQSETQNINRGIKGIQENYPVRFENRSRQVWKSRAEINKSQEITFYTQHVSSIFLGYSFIWILLIVILSIMADMSKVERLDYSFAWFSTEFKDGRISNLDYETSRHSERSCSQYCTWLFTFEEAVQVMIAVY